VKKPAISICLFLAVLAPMAAQTSDFDIHDAQAEDQFRGGVRSFNRGYFSDALVSIQKSLSLDPQSIIIQKWLGRIFLKSGFEEEALRTWERADRTGAADTVLRDWIQALRQRYGTARDVSRNPQFVMNTLLDGALQGGHVFKRPSSVRPLADGSFMLVAFATNEVLHYDANFRLIEVLRGGIEGFDRPYDVIEAGDGTYLVSEYGRNAISRINAAGNKISKFGVTGRGDGMLLGPQYLARDSRGYVYVADWGNSRVNKYDLSGTFILSIQGLAGPSGIAVSEDRVFVAERGKKRVSIFDTSGNYLRSIGEGDLQTPEGISFTLDGKLLVADTDKVRVVDVESETWGVKADVSGQAVRLVQQAVTPNGDILAVDFDGSRLLNLSDPALLYSGYVVRVDRVNAAQFPEVIVDFSVQDRSGAPIVGLGINNFIITESRRSVGPTTMILTNSSVTSTDVCLLVESSPAMTAAMLNAKKAADDLYGLATQGGRIQAVSAGENAVKETGFGETRLRFLSQAFQEKPSDKWRFDVAARVSGEELVTAVSTAKRAVVFFTSGAFSPQSFSTYSLTQIAAFMKYNAIAFYPVEFGSKGASEELSYLASETGGKCYSWSTPGGMTDVMRDIRVRSIPFYTVKYTSPSDAEFGTRYIPIEVEVTMQKVSGRDESGYFAPLTP
jgi:DNA-binding beta-propeller fold protein YncE